MTSGSSIPLQSKVKSEYLAVGAMAGSSMDGLDLALVSFLENEKWSYTIHKTKTVPYPDKLLDQFRLIHQKSQEQLQQLDLEFGRWIGEQTRNFLEHRNPDFVAVHGHTARHQPAKGISWQLGNGTEIANLVRLPTITAFRNKDISLEGQGAPLVPFGDFRLFSEYDACLNLGGIANVSIKAHQIAWDICPCNQVLNFFANKLGEPFDRDGLIATQGSLQKGFVKEVQSLPYFAVKGPKSLPNNYISEDLLSKIFPADGLHSYCVFIARQVARDLKNSKTGGKLLVTGGGALNKFLVNEIKENLSEWEISVPDVNIISFKEAIIFAFLGLMKMQERINTYASVTGATSDSSGGEVHLPE